MKVDARGVARGSFDPQRGSRCHSIPGLDQQAPVDHVVEFKHQPGLF